MKASSGDIEFMVKRSQQLTRIIKIDLKNFRAFRHAHSIELGSTGKNLVLYGENGSGKSSLFLAIKHFLLSSLNGDSIESHSNIFVPGEEVHLKFYIKNTLDGQSTASVFEWSRANPNGHNDPLIQESAKGSGFLDYRDLLQTHSLSTENGLVDIFPILVNVLLANIRNDATQKTFLEDWQEITESLDRRKTSAQIGHIKALIDNFNSGINEKLTELKQKITDIFGYFGYYDIILDFDFSGLAYDERSKKIIRKQVCLKVQFYDAEISSRYLLLNEAKLSAIALSIYLSALLLNPLRRADRFKVLVLDDVLIGLDMSNRMPIIKILNDYFSDYQIFLLTHDLEWFEILVQKLQCHPDTWQFEQLFCTKALNRLDGVEYEMPVFANRKDYLTKAKDYLIQNDYKASAIYLRTAFERIIKKYCDQNGVRIKYKEKAKELTSEDFWREIRDNVPTTLKERVEQVRTLIMNPLSHARIVRIYPAEVKDAIEVIEELQQALEATS